MQLSQGFCPFCGLQLTKLHMAFLLSEGFRLTCPQCSHRFSLERVHLELSKESKLRATPAGALASEWYHATLVPEWHEKVLRASAHVHLGERAAARDIILTELGSRHQGAPPKLRFHLWRLRLDGDCLFQEGLQEDVDREEAFTPGRVTLYLNRWEAPGTVSAYAPACFLEPLSHSVHTLEELWSEDSLYNEVVLPSLELLSR